MDIQKNPSVQHIPFPCQRRKLCRLPHKTQWDGFEDILQAVDEVACQGEGDFFVDRARFGLLLEVF